MVVSERYQNSPIDFIATLEGGALVFHDKIFNVEVQENGFSIKTE
jgi:hypothetical protein